MSVDKPPDQCPRCGGPYVPGKTSVRFMHCSCPGAEYGGHTTWECPHCRHVAAPGHETPDPPKVHG
jgi:hypothetical protein